MQRDQGTKRENGRTEGRDGRCLSYLRLADGQHEVIPLGLVGEGEGHALCVMRVEGRAHFETCVYS